jgi:hypothetical protein
MRAGHCTLYVHTCNVSFPYCRPSCLPLPQTFLVSSAWQGWFCQTKPSFLWIHSRIISFCNSGGLSLPVAVNVSKCIVYWSVPWLEMGPSQVPSGPKWCPDLCSQGTISTVRCPLLINFYLYSLYIYTSPWVRFTRSLTDQSTLP